MKAIKVRPYATRTAAPATRMQRRIVRRMARDESCAATDAPGKQAAQRLHRCRPLVFL